MTATERASAGRSVPIRINPDPARPEKGTDKARTTQKDRKDPIPGRPEMIQKVDEEQGEQHIARLDHTLISSSTMVKLFRV